MNKSAQTGIWITITLLVVAGIIYFAATQSNDTNTSNGSSESYVAFAQCLKTEGAIFYGAYWCPHCNDQKEMFGDAENELPYVECALPGSPNTMTQECKDAGVEGYPTWAFADGSQLSGTQILETLADKTGCTLPGADASNNESSTENVSVNEPSENINAEETPTEN